MKLLLLLWVVLLSSLVAPLLWVVALPPMVVLHVCVWFHCSLFGKDGATNKGKEGEGGGEATNGKREKERPPTGEGWPPT